MSRKTKQLQFNIKGIDWTFYCQSNSSYIKAHGSDSEAITYTKERKVYFNKSHLQPNAVIHEVFHAYVASCGTNSSSLKPDQVEELCCEIIAEHIFEILTQMKKILEYFNE